MEIQFILISRLVRKLSFLLKTQIITLKLNEFDSLQNVRPCNIKIGTVKLQPNITLFTYTKKVPNTLTKGNVINCERPK